MAQPNLIKIGADGDVDEISAFGRHYKEGFEADLYIEERASDGTLRRDVIDVPNKRVFTLDYSEADQDVVDRLDYLCQLHQELTLEVTHLEDTVSYTVLAGVFDKTRMLAVYGGLWGGVSVTFREV